jgi:hypothetical protein
MKKVLVADTLLTYPDLIEEFDIHRDASDYQLGAAAKKTKKLELLERLEVDRYEVIKELMDEDTLFRQSSIMDMIKSIETIQGIFEIYVDSQSAVVQKIVDFTLEMKKKTYNLDKL